MKICFFTICARNYLGYALTLRNSFLACNPGSSFYIFLADEPLDAPAPCGDIIVCDEIGLPNLRDMAFRYSLLEFSTAIKPYCFKHLFAKTDAEAAVYLDPDILILRPLDHVVEGLKQGAKAIITPHITAPLPDDGEKPTNNDLLRSGSYNLGFAAFAKSSEAMVFIDWWAEECRSHCLVDLEKGFFVDQKFAELIPSFIDSTQILRHPGYNAAYWNLAHRQIGRMANGDWSANGELLRFFHFSGVIPGDRNIFSKHQDRYKPENVGDASTLLNMYLNLLEENEVSIWGAIPYGFGFFQNGDFIPPAARRIYSRLKEAGETPKPFEENYARLNRKSGVVDQELTAQISEFMYEVWKMRPDLQSAFPLSSRRGRLKYRRWFVLNAEREGLSTPPLTIPARSGGLGSVVDMAIKVRGKTDIGKRAFGDDKAGDLDQSSP